MTFGRGFQQRSIEELVKSEQDQGVRADRSGMTAHAGAAAAAAR
jgi:hypothetical protein